MYRIILFCFLNLYLFACGQTHQSQKSFAYISKEKEQSFHDSIVNGMKKEMAKKGVHVDFFYPAGQNDIKSQENFINQILSNKKYAGVMIAPNDSGKILPALQKLDDQHLPYVVIDTDLTDGEVKNNLKYYCGYVGTNNRDVGKMAFDFLKEKLPAGNIVLVRGIHVHRSSSDREEGFLQSNKGYFTVSGYVAGNWKTEDAHKNYGIWSQSNKKIVDAVFAYNDHMGIGVSQTYRDKNRPLIVGVDATVLGQKALLEGKIDAIVVQATELMGVEGLDRLIDCLRAKTVLRKDVVTPITLLTATKGLERSMQ